MYTPPAFAVDELAWALELIGAYPFGLLMTAADAAPDRKSVV